MHDADISLSIDKNAACAEIPSAEKESAEPAKCSCAARLKYVPDDPTLMQPFQRCQDYCVTMDAVALVAAAVAIAIEDSRQAALNDLLLDRERAAMRAADAETQLAERVYKEAAQLRDVWRAARHQAARVARERAAARQQAPPLSELEPDTRARSRSPRR